MDHTTTETHYGPISVTVDHAARRAELTIRRRMEPLSNQVIERLHSWALSVTNASYPGYEIQDLCHATQEKEIEIWQ
jgi:hypothetical protein